MQKRKTILITGASQGIGAALVNTFAERGYNVVPRRATLAIREIGVEPCSGRR